MYADIVYSMAHSNNFYEKSGKYTMCSGVNYIFIQINYRVCDALASVWAHTRGHSQSFAEFMRFYGGDDALNGGIH